MFGLAHCTSKEQELVKYRVRNELPVCLICISCLCLVSVIKCHSRTLWCHIIPAYRTSVRHSQRKCSHLNRKWCFPLCVCDFQFCSYSQKHRERESESVCVCVCERERESVCVCLVTPRFLSSRMCVHMFDHNFIPRFPFVSWRSFPHSSAEWSRTVQCVIAVSQMITVSFRRLICHLIQLLLITWIVASSKCFTAKQNFFFSVFSLLSIYSQNTMWLCASTWFGSSSCKRALSLKKLLWTALITELRVTKRLLSDRSENTLMLTLTVCVCVCVCVREREFSDRSENTLMFILTVCVYVCVCVCERERESFLTGVKTHWCLLWPCVCVCERERVFWQEWKHTDVYSIT